MGKASSAFGQPPQGGISPEVKAQIRKKMFDQRKQATAFFAFGKKHRRKIARMKAKKRAKNPSPQETVSNLLITNSGSQGEGQK